MYELLSRIEFCVWIWDHVLLQAIILVESFKREWPETVFEGHNEFTKSSVLQNNLPEEDFVTA